MSKRIPGLRVVPVILILSMLLPVAALSAEENVQVAFLGLENLNRDPRYDYLEGMIVGVLMYDLIRVDNIDLVERARIERIIDEQSLRLTGLLRDTDTARQIGQLVEADVLIAGDYAFLGNDVNVNLSLMRVNDGRLTPFSVRGYTENAIHSLAEGVIEHLTGEPVILRGENGERSLLSLSDEEPGSIEFYCNFENGEIYVDEEFYGYTPGGTTPTLLEDLSPGEHLIRVEAGPNFGEIEWPQVVFKDWQRTVNVRADRKSVLRASVYHFNSLLYDAQMIFSENWRLGDEYGDRLSIREDASYTDRTGRPVEVILSAEGSVVNGHSIFTFRVDVDGETREWTVEKGTEEIEIEEQVGPVSIEFARDWYSNRYWEFDIDLRRTDIHQGMHRE